MTRVGALPRIAAQLGIHPEALRTCVKRTEIDDGTRPGTTKRRRSRGSYEVSGFYASKARVVFIAPEFHLYTRAAKTVRVPICLASQCTTDPNGAAKRPMADQSPRIGY